MSNYRATEASDQQAPAPAPTVRQHLANRIDELEGRAKRIRVLIATLTEAQLAMKMQEFMEGFY